MYTDRSLVESRTLLHSHVSIVKKLYRICCPLFVSTGSKHVSFDGRLYEGRLLVESFVLTLHPALKKMALSQLRMGFQARQLESWQSEESTLFDGIT